MNTLLGSCLLKNYQPNPIKLKPNINHETRSETKFF